LSDLGSKHGDVFLIPTDKNVCVFITAYDISGCFDEFTPQSPVAWDIRGIDQTDPHSPIVVSGVVPDGVVGVDVVVAGASQPATLADNAFFYETKASAMPDHLVISYSDGHRSTVDLGPQEPPTQ